MWPAELADTAIFVMTKENGSENPKRISGLNYDGSRDYGCMQLNNKAHPTFFATNNWSDSEANAREALTIYRGRGNWSAWYSVCTPARIPKYPGINCR